MDEALVFFLLHCAIYLFADEAGLTTFCMGQRDGLTGANGTCRNLILPIVFSPRFWLHQRAGVLMSYGQRVNDSPTMGHLAAQPKGFRAGIILAAWHLRGNLQPPIPLCISDARRPKA